MKKVTLIDKAFLLKRTPLFETLDLDLLIVIADKLGIVVFEEDEVLFAEGEEANRVYFIQKGEIEIKGRGLKESVVLQAGDFFGEESLFNEKPRAYSATSLSESQLLTLSRTNLLTIIAECPSVALGLLQVYTTKIPNRFIDCGGTP